VCESVTPGPIGTLGTGSSFRIVYALLVRAADNPVGDHGGAECVRLEEGQNLLTDGEIMAYVQVALGEPAVENVRLVIFRENHANGDFGGQFVVRSVEGYGGNGVAAKSRAKVRAQPRLDEWSLLAESLPSLHQSNIRPRFAKLSKTANRVRGLLM
jgi:hypothetical protein